MKILMLISSLETGGAETHLCELSRALAELGHSVTVASAKGELCERLGEYGVSHFEAELGKKAPLSLLRSYFALVGLMKRERFDVVHAHSRIAAILGERASKRCELPFVTTIHARFSLGFLRRRLSRWGYYTSAVSEDLAEYLCDNYSISPSRVEVIPNGVDTIRFAPNGNKRNRIVFVSRLDADCSDGAYALCRVAKRICEERAGVTIRIVGKGGELSSLSRLAESVNCEAGYQLISLAGRVSEVERELVGALAFVGVGRCAIEAMACGVPVIVAGNEGYFGVLSENNVREAAACNFCARGYERMTDERLLSDLSALLHVSERDREELSASLRRYAVKSCDVESCAKRTVDFYKKALKSVSFDDRGVCLCGYYGYGNVGDDTLLEAAIERVRRTFDTDGITVLAHSPRTARYRFGVPCANRYNIISVARAVHRSRALVFGGGTLFQDRTSLRSLLYYFSVACAAFCLGKRVELWGNGLCPLRSALSRAVVRFVLKGAAYVGVRDKPSLKIAELLRGGEKGIFFEGDLALSIKARECDGDFRTRRLTDKLCRYSIFAISKSTEPKYYSHAKGLAEKLSEKGSSIIVVAMYPSEDREICRRFALEVGGEYAEGLFAKELVCILKKADFCASARLHLLIFSRIAGTPFEALGEDEKLIAFCEENGGRHSQAY